MNDIEGKKIIIKDLFSREFFYRIPEYQRPFCWEERNFKDLINDLTEAKKDQEYFLGTVVLHKQVDKTYEIVDGQQRLTTIIILFACLRDVVEDERFKKDIQSKIQQEENVVDGIPARDRLETKDREIFERMVIKEGGTLNKIDRKERVPSASAPR